MTSSTSPKINEFNNRSELLDVAKGLAITLVVLGHTIQNQNLEFDNSLAFRMIYSFHMPLFAFLSGAAASYWSTYLKSKNDLFETILSSTTRIFKSAKQLILPFIVWSIIAFYINYSQESPFDYFYKVAKNPDYGLWFLLCIFWCSTYICLLFPVILLLRKMIEGSKLEKYKETIFSPITQFLFVLTIWSLVIKKLPGTFGIGYANSFNHGLFLYFLMGLFFSTSFKSSLKSRLE